MSIKQGRRHGDPVVKALAHPLRLRMLRVLNNRVASPSDLAKELDEPLTTVSYHMRTLVKCSCVELVRTERRRGTIEHFYRATMRPMVDDGRWSTLAPTVRDEIVGQTLREIFAHVAAASHDGGFEDPKAHVSLTTFSLDAQGWDAMAELLGETLDRAMGIAATSAGRLGPGRSEEERRTELAIVHFHRSPGRS
jgi:DNA-binding transcriptional ArsR family regulator